MPDGTSETPGAKMMFPIRRRPGIPHEELVAHWFKNHMPLVVAREEGRREAGRAHAKRYWATLFDPDRSGERPWDGIAQLWYDAAWPYPKAPYGEKPADSFQERAEPYWPWAPREYVVIEGPDALAVEPLTLNDPFPTTRSGFHKVTFLVATKPGADPDALFEHWLDAHVPNVRGVLERVGGLRYAVSHSTDLANAPFAGMAEIWVPDRAAWKAYTETIQPDGMEAWVDPEATRVLYGRTEMIGIP